MSEESPRNGNEFSEADTVDRSTPAFPDDAGDGLPEEPGPDGFVGEADWLDQQCEVPLSGDDPDIARDRD